MFARPLGVTTGGGTFFTVKYMTDKRLPNIITVGFVGRDDGTIHQQDYVQHPDGISRALVVGTHGNAQHYTKTIIDDNNMDNQNFKLPPELQGKKFRIRKLTPRECFRLMGVDDADIDKIQAAGISNSSQYKLAGNSIVVDVLYHIFRKAFVETEPDYKFGQQLSLFGMTDQGMEPAYNKHHPLRVVTLCSGYDSQCLALNRLKQHYPDFDYELIAWSEFDPESKRPLDQQPAVIAHNALFPQWADRNLGDMTKIDWVQVPDFDLLFYSIPCTDISAAGLQMGFAEGSGTRSSIIWDVRDAIKIKRPKYACLENVKAMVSQKFLPMFNLWQTELERLGYANFAKVLNAKDYGVPQNRERLPQNSRYLSQAGYRTSGEHCQGPPRAMERILHAEASSMA